MGGFPRFAQVGVTASRQMWSYEEQRQTDEGVDMGSYRVRCAVCVAALAGLLLVLGGCSTATPGTSGETSTTPAASSSVSPGNSAKPGFMVNRDKIFFHVTKVYDAAQYPMASMDGEPSGIPFFKPVHDEGPVNRDYPTYDDKTFKFLSLPGSMIAPQDYYMFQKDGGTLNSALKGTGYKAAEILDSGHIKILPNLYLGYYDFAWVPLNVMTEYWSGNESMNQELWRRGDSYVVIGNSWNGGTSLLAAPAITNIKQLAGKTVGIMNPAFNIEALLQKKLASVGMATGSAGGTVNIEMASPGFVMNDLLAMKNSAVFAWGMYASTLQKQGYHELVSWKDMGYGTNVPYQVLVVRRDIAEKHPEIVQKVVQLNYDATKLALAGDDWQAPTAARYEYYWSHFMGSPGRAMAPASLVKLDAQASPVFLHGVIDYMTKSGYFKVPYTYDDLVDESFYAKVKK